MRLDKTGLNPRARPAPSWSMWTKPEWTGLDRATPAGSGSDWAGPRPDGTGWNRFRPGSAGSDWTEGVGRDQGEGAGSDLTQPDETGSDQAEPDWAVSLWAEPDFTGFYRMGQEWTRAA